MHLPAATNLFTEKRQPDAQERKRVLIVGAGQRVQNAFLPVFRILDSLFSLVGLVAAPREPDGRALASSQSVLPAIASLEDFELDEVDVVVLSVPASQNAEVLKRLLPWAARLHVVIDPPIAGKREELAATVPLLAQFAFVIVAEDHMNLPIHRIARQAVADGVVGALRSVTLLNSGYLHHGLAIIRSFAGFPKATGSWRKPLGSYGSIIGFEFPDGFSGTIVGPYRRRDRSAGLLVEGGGGIITESADDAIGTGRKTFLLRAERLSSGVLTGYRITGPGYGLVKQLPHLEAMRKANIADTSEINLVRNCALIDVLLSVFDGQGINRDYGYKHCLYDSFASQRVNNGTHKLDTINLGLD